MKEANKNIEENYEEMEVQEMQPTKRRQLPIKQMSKKDKLLLALAGGAAVGAGIYITKKVRESNAKNYDKGYNDGYAAASGNVINDVVPDANGTITF